MNIYIKNMVCNRCIAAVDHIFNKMGISVEKIMLGEVVVRQELTSAQLLELSNKLVAKGFALLENSTQKALEQIKSLVIQTIATLDLHEDFMLSQFLSNKLNKDYSALSKLFSQNSEMTLEQFFILQKIEKVKELLMYDEFTLTEISQKLGYKSVQHLSAQFRSVTGFTPTQFKNKKNTQRIPLDTI